jgi:hypothetical protein
MHGSVDGLGAMLQVGRSKARVPVRSFNVFHLSNPSRRSMALGLTQPLTEMSTRISFWGIVRPARKADNLSAICEPIVYKMWEPERLTTL